jgi:polysaccharide biosynthesis/export protein
VPSIHCCGSNRPGMKDRPQTRSCRVRLWLGIGTLALAALTSGCVASNVPVASLESINSDLNDGYRLSAGDKVKVTVFDEKSLSGEYKVGDAGDLAFPLIEKIDANGKTPEQIAGIIADRLRDGGYVLSPRVSVEVLEYRPFFILGEVAKPGEYAYTTKLTLEQAVAKAGGYTPRADRKIIQLKRQDWPTARRVKLEGPALKIAPGDTITVQESFF